MIRKTVEGREFESQMVGELHFDQTPKEGSFNPVTSDAVVKAIDEAKEDMQEKIDEVTLDPSAVALGNVHLLDEVTEFPADGCILIDSETNGPGEMSKDTLLELTAQNALAGNLAKAFNSASTYKKGERVSYQGKTYIFKTAHTGAWSAGDVYNIENFPLGMYGDATTIGMTDANDAYIGSVIWCQGSDNINHIPLKDDGVTYYSGNLLTYSRKHDFDSSYVTQIFCATTAALFVRFKQYGGTWTDWNKLASTSDMEIALRMMGNIDTFGIKNANNAPPATFYWCQPDSSYSNFPVGENGNFLAGNLLTLNRSVTNTGTYLSQMYFGAYGTLFVRFKQYGGTWTDWNLLNNQDNNTPELSMFIRVGVVGDSYASALVYSPGGVSEGTRYPISWPQILGRKTGCTWINFSKGGLSTRTWLTDADYGLAKLESEDPCDLYLLVLGINDRAIAGYLGSITDITSHESYTDYPDTFYGNYGKIVEQILGHAPAAKIIFSTMSSNVPGQPSGQYNEAIIEIANHYNIPYIEQHKDSYFSSSVYQTMYGQHPTKAGQSGMARAFERMICNCIAKNLTYFNSFDGET